MYPVKETKELLRPVYSLLGAIMASKADGTINLLDFPHFIPVLTELGPAIDGIDKVPSELGDLTEAEGQELLDDAKLYLPQVGAADLVAKVNAALKVAVAVAAAYAVFKGTTVAVVTKHA
jgi:hypothetical protein